MNRYNFFLLAFILYSCENESIKENHLLKFKVDSLFQLEEKALILKMDSICALKYNARKQIILDSIVEVRKQEIIQLQKGL